MVSLAISSKRNPSAGEWRKRRPRRVAVSAVNPQSMTTVRSGETAAQTKKSMGVGTSWGSWL